MGGRAVIVAQDGTTTSEWAGTVGDITFVANGHGGSNLSGSIHDTGADEWMKFLDGTYTVADTATHEVQIFDGDDVTPFVWFCPTGVRVDPAGKLDVPLAGLTWLFEKRNIGTAGRINHLLNPSFEDTLSTEWEAVNCDIAQDSAHYFTAGNSLEITARTDADAFATQTVDSPGNGVGVLWILTGWAFVHPGFFSGPALENRGLYIERLDGSLVVLQGEYARITDEFLPGRWTRLRTMIACPPDADETIRCRVYAVDGAISWDDLHLVQMESATFNETDVFTILEYLINLAQATAIDKDDLAITVSGSATGVLVNRSYQYAEHLWTWDQIRELIDSFPDGDLAVRMLPGTRTFQVDSPRHSTTVDPLELRYGPDVDGNRRDNEIVSWPASADFNRGFNQPIIVSDFGDGADREEAGFTATGRVFEQVLTAPDGSSIDSLEPYAANLAAENEAPVAFTVNLKPTADVDLIAMTKTGDFVIGDLVTLDIRAGAYHITSTWQTVSATMNLDTRQVTLTLNRA